MKFSFQPSERRPSTTQIPHVPRVPAAGSASVASHPIPGAPSGARTADAADPVESEPDVTITLTPRQARQAGIVGLIVLVLMIVWLAWPGPSPSHQGVIAADALVVAAPGPGSVLRLYVTPGEAVQTGQQLFIWQPDNRTAEREKLTAQRQSLLDELQALQMQQALRSQAQSASNPVKAADAPNAERLNQPPSLRAPSPAEASLIAAQQAQRQQLAAQLQTQQHLLSLQAATQTDVQDAQQALLAAHVAEAQLLASLSTAGHFSPPAPLNANTLNQPVLPVIDHEMHQRLRQLQATLRQTEQALAALPTPQHDRTVLAHEDGVVTATAAVRAGATNHQTRR